ILDECIGLLSSLEIPGSASIGRQKADFTKSEPVRLSRNSPACPSRLSTGTVRPMKLNCLLLRFSWPAIVVFLFSATAVGAGSAQSTARASATASKTFIDYFQPTPILSPLSTTAWGMATVGLRDQKNGLEDPTMKLWDYWDG